jgi:hypothetical protein
MGDVRAQKMKSQSVALGHVELRTQSLINVSELLPHFFGNFFQKENVIILKFLLIKFIK